MDNTAQETIEARWERERRTKQLLDYLFDAMREYVRAVPREGPGDLPPHDLIMTSEIDGAEPGDVLRALERNLGTIASLLMPDKVVTLVRYDDLRVLLQAAGRQTGLPLWSTDSLQERALSTLDGWSNYRGQIFDREER